MQRVKGLDFARVLILMPDSEPRAETSEQSLL